MFGAEFSQQVGTTVVFDLDFRPDQWHDPRAFGVVARSVLPNVDVVIGTEDEINAAVLSDASQMSLTHSQVSDAKVEGDVKAAINWLLELGPEAVVEKVGALGSRVHLASGEVLEAPGFPVEIYNILGAGDAFGAGFIYGFVNDWGWQRSARLGNACGAIVVLAHGCANFMPTYDEVMAFVEERGGL
jgi:5-dehydro-2-deoxygluconokinase